MVESLATTMHSRPSMRAMPVISPAPWMASSYMRLAASGDSSRNGEPGSSRVMTRSRGSRFAAPLQLGHEFLHAYRIGPKLRSRGIDPGRENRHDLSPSKRLPFRAREGNAEASGAPGGEKFRRAAEQFPVPVIGPCGTQ